MYVTLKPEKEVNEEGEVGQILAVFGKKGNFEFRIQRHMKGMGSLSDEQKRLQAGLMPLSGSRYLTEEFRVDGTKEVK